MNDARLLTKREAARLCGVRVATIDRFIADGLPTITPKGCERPRIRRGSLEAFLRRLETEQGERKPQRPRPDPVDERRRIGQVRNKKQ